MTRLTLIYTDFFINFCDLGEKDKISENPRHQCYLRSIFSLYE